ncbi:DsbA family protein [Stutzerimonas nosocomialis]|uniref:DsbA family protein n=1 Tax=Stutzerimonas nosocomialis TaxID=1056496 RepID=UPI0011098552|nr:DsbA family protein [Stutzerimonas nosocomialis]TLX60507.1 DsbA family protein [Stutzerimonas nosocomialis]
MTARLVYVMDPMCSWCWGFAPVLDALAGQAEAAGVGLHLVVGGLRSEHSPMDAAGRERIQSYWRAVEQATGQRFDYQAGMPAGFVYDTERACRALVAARLLDVAAVLPLAHAIQQAFYLQGSDTGSAPVLVDLAEGVGLARDAFAERFDSLEALEQTRADFAWAQNLGIAGFPTLLAERDGQLALLTNGYQPLERLSPLLARWLEQGAHA